MNSEKTRLYVYDRSSGYDGIPRGFCTAASLHCHTSHSKEMLTFIPHYTAMIPVISRMFSSEMDRYLTLHGKTIDFAHAHWTPPVSPRQVLEIETLQIEKTLGLPALVSITDHDDIEAGLRLQVLDQAKRIPISLEWTVPYRHGFFHLGVHNLPPESAAEIGRELKKYAAQADDALELADLFARLNECPETLIVLNHPLWDIEFIGAAEHAECLKLFLGEYGQWIHACEINGFRSWRENQAVMRMAVDLGFPVVTGGDRHGCQPNSLLNLTRAGSFDEFVAEVRDDGHSEALLMPEYGESRLARTLETVADVLRSYPSHWLGQMKWTDRIFIDLAGDGEVRALSHHWPRGGPVWVRAVLWCIRTLGSSELQPALRLALANEKVTNERMSYES